MEITEELAWLWTAGMELRERGVLGESSQYLSLTWSPHGATTKEKT